MMPPLSERLRDLWSDITFGDDAVATLIAIVAVLLFVATVVLYFGVSASAWRWWMGL